MDKSKALIAALAFAAGTGAGTAISQPAKSTVEVVTISMSRGEPLDGGAAQWNARACGIESQAGKRVGEPCWVVSNVPGSVVAPLESRLSEARSK